MTWIWPKSIEVGTYAGKRVEIWSGHPGVIFCVGQQGQTYVDYDPDLALTALLEYFYPMAHALKMHTADNYFLII